MVIISETNDTLTIKNPHTSEVLETLIGKKISSTAFVAFSQMGIYWAWVLHEFDAEINGNEVFPTSGKNTAVNPDGFIYNDEIYKIRVGQQ